MWRESSDPDNCFGVAPFLPLPTNDEFQRAAALHDKAFDEAERLGKKYEHTRAEEDWNLFYRLVLLAHAETDAHRRCDRAETICRYWPLAREFGHIWWEGRE
jgi:hypothetical protein